MATAGAPKLQHSTVEVVRQCQRDSGVVSLKRVKEDVIGDSDVTPKRLKVERMMEHMMTCHGCNFCQRLRVKLHRVKREREILTLEAHIQTCHGCRFCQAICPVHLHGNQLELSSHEKELSPMTDCTGPGARVECDKVESSSEERSSAPQPTVMDWVLNGMSILVP